MGRVVIPGFRKIETSGGGEGGTSNYNDLTNKPSINNTPLVGNLNTVDLKLTDETLTEEGVPAEAKTVGTKLEEQSTSLTALSEQLGNHTVKSDVPENAVFTDTVYDDTEVQSKLNNKRDKVLSGNIIDNGKTGFYKIATITDSGNYSFISFGIDVSNGTYYDKLSVILRKSPDGFTLEGGIFGRESDLIKISVESKTSLGLYISKRMAHTSTFYEIYNFIGEDNTAKIKGCSPTIASESIEYLGLSCYYDLFNKNRNIIPDLDKRISDNGYGELAGGKNLIPYEDMNNLLSNMSDNVDGTTHSYADGVLTVNRIADVNSGVYVYNSIFKRFNNKKIKISFDAKSSVDGMVLKIFLNDSDFVYTPILTSEYKRYSVELLARDTKNNFIIYGNTVAGEVNIKNVMFSEAVYNDTSYEPYFPSNKMLAEDVDDINSNLSNLEENTKYKVTSYTVYNGYSEAGKITIAEAVRSVWFKCGKNTTICAETTNSNARNPEISFTDEPPKSGLTTYNKNKSNSGEHEYCTIFYWYIEDSVSKEDALNGLEIYSSNIGSEIDSIKNDLGGLSFSVSDGTLSITDGANTWTLPQTT